MNKRNLIIILLIIIALFFSLKFYESNRVKTFNQTLKIDSNKVTTIIIEKPGNMVKVVKDATKIKEFTDYFNNLQYKNKTNNELINDTKISPYFIYLYQNQNMAFIYPHKTDILISDFVYNIEDGSIDIKFLDEYFNSIE